jgi:hypothetical protein
MKSAENRPFRSNLFSHRDSSRTIEKPASLRSDGVRDHPGMPFGFLPEQAFSFAGIPNNPSSDRELLMFECYASRTQPFSTATKISW